MVDEMFDRGYRNARAELNSALSDGLRHLRQSVGQAFKVLVRIQYDAPWSKRSGGAHSVN